MWTGSHPYEVHARQPLDRELADTQPRGFQKRCCSVQVYDAVVQFTPKQHEEREHAAHLLEYSAGWSFATRTPHI